MKYQLIIQPPALDDLDQACQWLAERSPLNAARWFNRFVEALVGNKRACRPFLPPRPAFMQRAAPWGVARRSYPLNPGGE